MHAFDIPINATAICITSKTLDVKIFQYTKVFAFTITLHIEFECLCDFRFVGNKLVQLSKSKSELLCCLSR